jgi:hypothetical protein
MTHFWIVKKDMEQAFVAAAIGIRMPFRMKKDQNSSSSPSHQTS